MSIQAELEEKIRVAFRPSHILLENESHMHGGAQNSEKIRESHFKAVIISEAFSGKRLSQRHQLVYRALGNSMQQIHALALHTYTPEEWSARGNAAPGSPQCPKSPQAQLSQGNASQG